MAPPKNRTLPVEPVNSEQAEAQETAASDSPVLAAGPTSGELEERTVQAEERAEDAERRNDALASEMEELKRQMALLVATARSPQARADAAAPAAPAGGIPQFDEDLPYGVVYGDAGVGFVQAGHQFAHDRSYVTTEPNRGAGRPFNPRLVGAVKPRPGQTVADALADFRDS